MTDFADKMKRDGFKFCDCCNYWCNDIRNGLCGDCERRILELREREQGAGRQNPGLRT